MHQCGGRQPGTTLYVTPLKMGVFLSIPPELQCTAEASPAPCSRLKNQTAVAALTPDELRTARPASLKAPRH